MAEYPQTVGPLLTISPPIPRIVITPDLGWESVDRMLDTGQNEAAVSVYYEDLTLSAATASTYVSHAKPILNIDGIDYELPIAGIGKLRGNNTKHYFMGVGRMFTGNIGSFILRIDLPPIEEL